jgi:hypothetical protein
MLAVPAVPTAVPASTVSAAGLKGLNLAFDDIEIVGLQLADIVVDSLLSSLEFHISITGIKRI